MIDLPRGQLAGDHYAVLGLKPPPFGGSQPTSDVFKASYRQALLVNHPDKAESLPTNRSLASAHRVKEENARRRSSNTSKPTVDDICAAYRVLSDPRRRHEYDAQLIEVRRRDGYCGATNAARQGHKKNTTTELDVVDLDEMDYDEATSQWTRPCRCGKSDGFTIHEDHLLDEDNISGPGEAFVECADCSHHIKVVFAVASDDGKVPPSP